MDNTNIKPDPTFNVLALVEASAKRLDDLREADSRRLTEQAIMREDFAEKLRQAEAKRLDSIRTTDVATIVTTTTALAEQTALIAAQQNARIAAVEKYQYENSGGSAGMKTLWSYVFAVIVLLISVAIAFYK